MAADELEDYLESRNPKVKASIAASRKDYSVAGPCRPRILSGVETKRGSQDGIAPSAFRTCPRSPSSPLRTSTG